MYKHYKIISSIVCLLLCVCMVTFGVYAAKYGLVALNSTVSFAPTTAKLKIFGGIADYAILEPNDTAVYKYYACNYGTEQEEKNYETITETNGKKIDQFEPWRFGKIFFDEYDETATITKPDPICFYLQITNYVETQVYYTITLNQPSNKLEYSFAYEIIDNSSEELNNQASAPANGWWWIGATEASNPTFHNNEDIRPGNNPSNILTATDGTDCKIVDLPEEVDTTLKTVMLVVKVSVKDDENSLLGEDFSFTVTATTSKLNS